MLAPSAMGTEYWKPADLVFLFGGDTYEWRLAEGLALRQLVLSQCLKIKENKLQQGVFGSQGLGELERPQPSHLEAQTPKWSIFCPTGIKSAPHTFLFLFRKLRFKSGWWEC